MDTDKIIRWGIIGCGNVTEKKSGPAYYKTKGFEVAAVMRRDKDKAKDYAQRHGIRKYYTDADALIRDGEIDAIYIATPPDTHKYYALKTAQAGKPCCIEKPMAPSHADCLDIQRAFENAGIPLFVAYYRRSLPRFTQVKNWLHGNRIGEVRHISWHLSKPATPQDLSGEYNWRTDREIAPGGYFDDLASHGLDLFTFLLGDISDVHGISTNQQGLYQAKDAMTACWIHENGITGSGSWNFGSHTRTDRVEISGSLGSITFSVFEEAPLTLLTQESTQELFVDNPEHIQLHHVENMQRQLSGAGIHPSTGSTAVHTAWIMDKILGTL
ncbi:Predicted dehydrogenase [Sinomicrobium oceani]|uniref:Predicted dehydrogenase n=1 Tax=Sinomicrobium oceani TaxID=1150368 RepID=A0A1K1LMF3_9FLAO|nr:Gfo/Idh/MocA family oxidoreductase [Sinomicrobium oceani]SFW12035.1 Predicted dehydrogenase [Sinomicrobium oceani]